MKFNKSYIPYAILAILNLAVSAQAENAVAGIQVADTIKIESVRNELLIASLGKTNASQEEKNIPISEAELEKANRKLKAAEARLIEEAKKSSGSSEIKDSNQAELDSVEKLESPIKAKDGQASLNVNKVTDEAELKKELSQDVFDNTAALNSATIKQDNSAELELAIANFQQRNAELEQELSTSEEKVGTLSKELDDTRSRLMIAETQVERLSSIIGTEGSSQKQIRPALKPRTAVAPHPTQNRYTPPAPIAEPADDMQVATVIADKVNLRTGPSKDNSPLMAVTKGTRLAVETRNNNWFRVITPTGGRAWISSDAVSFGIKPETNAGKFGRSKTFEINSEDMESFDFGK